MAGRDHLLDLIAGLVVEFDRVFGENAEADGLVGHPLGKEIEQVTVIA